MLFGLPQHFYHAVDTGCNYEQNWETYAEFPAPDRTWIPDVYAIKDSRKIVFDIQISTISPNDLEERDKKYLNEGIESYRLPDNLIPVLNGDLHRGQDNRKTPAINLSMRPPRCELHRLNYMRCKNVGTV